MARVMLSARVTDTQAAALKGYAAEAGLPLYQATVRALEHGIAALVSGRGIGAVRPAATGFLAAEIEALREAVDMLSVRAELTDRLVQRTLYAAGAAYAAALAAVGDGAPPERLMEIKAEIARDSDQIFDRQLARARQGRSDPLTAQ